MTKIYKTLTIALAIIMIISLCACQQSSGATGEPEELSKYRPDVESQLAQTYPGEEIIPIKARVLNDSMNEYVYSHDGTEVVISYLIPGSPLDEMLAAGELDEAYEKYYKYLDDSEQTSSEQIIDENNPGDYTEFGDSSSSSSSYDDYVSDYDVGYDFDSDFGSVKTHEETLDVMETFTEMRKKADEMYSQASEEDKLSYRVMFKDNDDNEIYEIVYTDGVVEYQQFMFKINVNCGGRTVQMYFDPGRFYTEIDLNGLKSSYDVEAVEQNMTQTDFDSIEDTQILSSIKKGLSEGDTYGSLDYYDFDLKNEKVYTFNLPEEFDLNGRFGGDYVDYLYLYPDYNSLGMDDMLLRAQGTDDVWGNSISSIHNVQLVIGTENNKNYIYFDELINDLGNNPTDSEILEYAKKE